MRVSKQYDFIPDGVAFGDINENAAGTAWVYNSQQITGFNQKILLSVTYNEDVQLWYLVSAFNFTPAGFLAPGIQGFTTIFANDSFYVNPDEYVLFGVTDVAGAAVNGVTVSRYDPSLDTYINIDFFDAEKL